MKVKRKVLNKELKDSRCSKSSSCKDINKNSGTISGDGKAKNQRSSRVFGIKSVKLCYSEKILIGSEHSQEKSGSSNSALTQMSSSSSVPICFSKGDRNGVKQTENFKPSVQSIEIKTECDFDDTTSTDIFDGPLKLERENGKNVSKKTTNQNTFNLRKVRKKKKCFPIEEADPVPTKPRRTKLKIKLKGTKNFVKDIKEKPEKSILVNNKPKKGSKEIQSQSKNIKDHKFVSNNENKKNLNERDVSLKKKRNNERRKEKSRDAARCRRGKESEIFNELGALLPLDVALSATLDKASIIRVAIAYLRTRSLVTWGLDVPSESVSAQKKEELKDVEAEMLQSEGVLGALDGFLIVLTKESEVVYTSENISTFLGLSQIDVIGHSLLDYTHPCDHDEVRHLTSLSRDSVSNNTFLRFKCTLTPKGRNVNLKSATYKVVQMTGQVLTTKEDSNESTPSDTMPAPGAGTWVVALGVPVPHPSNIEVPLDKQTFVSKHSLDMKFIYVDENVKDFCGYRPADLLGQSLFQLNHAFDTQLVKEAYKTLRSKGQVETGRYRFLSCGGGYVWVVTQATLITGHRDNKPQYVVCLNYVVSGVECGDIIFSDCQLEASTSGKPASICSQAPSSEVCGVPGPIPSVVLPQVTSSASSAPSRNLASKPSPVAATCSLLRDRTEDMNEGYLTFADNDSHVTILKEEPEDLTHLAPSVGEDCVPLEVPVFFDELLESGTGGFDLEKNSSSNFLKEPVGGSIESLLDAASSNQTSSEDPNWARAARPHRVSSGPNQKLKFQEFSQTNFSASDQNSVNYFHKVPDLNDSKSPMKVGLTSKGLYNISEAAFSPLLTQAASSNTEEKFKNSLSLEGPKPVPATTRLFAELNEDPSTKSTMDIFSNLDIKFEDDLELTAPYIPPIDEVLVLDHDEFFDLSTTGENHDGSLEENFNFGGKAKQVGVSNNITSDNLGSYSPQPSFHNNKLGADTGGSFVDPNQVLPGQFYIKGEEKDNLQELRYLLEAPPPSPVKEPVDPPPPLKEQSPRITYAFVNATTKRPSSPGVATPHKKLRPFEHVISSAESPHRRGVPPTNNSPPSAQKRELSTPHAPLMQQLLNEDESFLDADSPLLSFPLNKEGKIELTRKQLSDLLDRAGTLRSSQRVVQEGESMPPTPPESVSPACFSPATPATPATSETSKEKPLLMLDSNLTSIPSLFDLTSFDCEVNAPAPDPSLLQGSELLMALEQTQ